MKFALAIASISITLFISNCASPTANYKVPSPSMEGPTVEERNAKIDAEEPGDYFIGRRYYTQNTRFWGYVRKPQESWSKANLVMVNEWQKKAPDRLKEGVKGGYGHDSNYEYKLYGYYSGFNRVYEPNSNQFLKEFVITGYEVLDKNPGWIFSPADRYHPTAITLRP